MVGFDPESILPHFGKTAAVRALGNTIPAAWRKVLKPLVIFDVGIYDLWGLLDISLLVS